MSNDKYVVMHGREPVQLHQGRGGEFFDAPRLEEVETLSLDRARKCVRRAKRLLGRQYTIWKREAVWGVQVDLALLKDNQQVGGGAPEGHHYLYTQVE